MAPRTKKSAPTTGLEPAIQSAVTVVPEPVTAPRQTAYSFSRLTTYDKCSELYRLTYVERAPDIRQDTVATRLGSICHTSLEEFYAAESTAESPFHALMRPGGIWEQELVKDGLIVLWDDLQVYASHISQLVNRASASYRGPDKIRKADGAVASAPEMTSAWKAYASKHQLYRMAGNIDRTAAGVNPEKWGSLSLSEVFTATLSIMWSYQHPAAIADIVDIELEISETYYAAADANGDKMADERRQPVPTTRNRGPHKPWEDEHGKTEQLFIKNPFPLPKLDGRNILKTADDTPIWSTTSLFNGFIDLLARDQLGRLLIIDHKTSKGDAPAVDKVAMHEQLLIYGYVIYYATGEVPHQIGINHLRSGKLVLADFNLAKAEKAVARLLTLQAAIEAKVFLTQDPYGYGARCVTESFRSDKPPTLCPGLRYCHPEVWSRYAKTEAPAAAARADADLQPASAYDEDPFAA
jgi:hypothetical protein